MRQRTDTIFSKMTFLFIIYSTILFIFVFSLGVLILRQHNREQNMITYESLINTIMRSIEATVTELHEVSVQLSCEPNLTASVTTQGHSFSKTKSELAITASKHSMIRSIHLYIPKKNKVITSDYREDNIKESLFSDEILRYLERSASLYQIYYNSCITKLFFYEDRMYLVREFPTSGKGKLGILFFEMNTEMFLEQIDELRGPGASLIILDAEENLLARYSDPYNSELSAAAKEMNRLKETVRHEENHTGFAAASSLLGWNFYLFVEDIPLFSLGDLFRYIIPLECGIILCCLFLAFALNKYLIRPIQTITRLATDETEPAAPPAPLKSRELSILQQTVARYITSSRQFQKAMENVMSHISNNFFVDLCEGRQMDEAYIRTCLEHMHSSLTGNGCYGIVLYQMSDQCHYLSSGQLLQKTINEYMEIIASDACRCHTQLYPMQQLMLIIEFDKNISLSQFDLYMKKIQHDTSSRLTERGLSCKISSSSVCYSIQEIYYGYKEALKYLDGSTQPEPASAPAGANMPDAAYHYDHLSESIQRMITALLEKNQDASLHMLSSQLHTWQKNITELRAFQELCVRYAHILSSQMIGLDILDAKAFFSGSSIEENILHTSSIPESAGAVFTFSKECFSLIEASQKKKNHKYIIAAQNYIAEHYMNPNLSLDMVAAHIHANSSYLSKLFKNNLNVNFVNYLNSYRIREAQQLLLTTNLSVKAISAQSGFNSEQNFIRVFKKHVQMTPTQYRTNRPPVS